MKLPKLPEITWTDHPVIATYGTFQGTYERKTFGTYLEAIHWFAENYTKARTFGIYLEADTFLGAINDDQVLEDVSRLYSLLYELKASREVINQMGLSYGIGTAHPDAKEILEKTTEKATITPSDSFFDRPYFHVSTQEDPAKIQISINGINLDDLDPNRNK